MSMRLQVNPIACTGHGLCADLLPELIELDEWGYPIIDGRALPPVLVEHAERAVRACPTFALLVEKRAAHPHPSRPRPQPKNSSAVS
jgi:ferredoxin